MFDAHIVAFLLYLNTECRMLQQSLYQINVMYQLVTLFHHALMFQLLEYNLHLQIFPFRFFSLYSQDSPNNFLQHLHTLLTFFPSLPPPLHVLRALYVLLAIKTLMNVKMGVSSSPNERHYSIDYIILVNHDMNLLYLRNI